VPTSEGRWLEWLQATSQQTELLCLKCFTVRFKHNKHFKFQTEQAELIVQRMRAIMTLPMICDECMCQMCRAQLCDACSTTHV